MGNVRFFSDPHFGHLNMALKRGFKSAEEQDEYIVQQWNSVVNKRDITYILGDITYEKKSGYEILSRLNGLKHVVLGNHDRRQDVEELLKYVKSVSGVIKYKRKYFLSHCPIHPAELGRVKVNIHGHVHEDSIVTYKWDYENKVDTEVPHPKYKNVSAEAIDYTPKLLTELFEDE
tara:strand:- start:38437 stop:38961 length:525 start_codon:yes stop_codon:yes gene_type:complete